MIRLLATIEAGDFPNVLAGAELVDQATEGPDVALDVVRHSVDKLGRHVVRSLARESQPTRGHHVSRAASLTPT